MGYGWFRCGAAVALLGCGVAAQGKGPSLRGLMQARDGAVWASGSGGTVLRSVDQGQTFLPCGAWEDSATLDFRGIFAWNAQHAMVMSAGPGQLSRVYETVDGCRSWKVRFRNPDADGFWDAIVFSETDPQAGVLLGDPVQGRFTIFRTSDGGENWRRDTDAALASNPAGEGAFAASNSALAMVPGTHDLVFGTGGAAGARMFHFDGVRQAWSSVAVPVAGRKESSGIFSVQFRDGRTGVTVGGDYKQPQKRGGTAFFTLDGGLTWTASTATPGGYRSAVSWDTRGRRWVAAGPTGADVSVDNGRTWVPLNDGNWNALSLPWAAGPDGRVGRISK